MKNIITICFMLFCYSYGHSQLSVDNRGPSKKGKLYIYWGWHIGGYNKSDITFTGDHYDFTLKDVVAKDRQSKFKFDTFFSADRFTIPQYNFRIGYFIKDNWDISFGIDHMKYVVQQNQSVGISGFIDEADPLYNGTYVDQEIIITPSFLLYEHTDGLNYFNVELRHSDLLFEVSKIKVNLTEGFGLGFLLPRTDATLLEKRRHDEFHIAGYGLGGVLGLNITFFDIFFIQAETKGGYINLPNVRTTWSESDKASQDFFFYQLSAVVGGYINLRKKYSRPKAKSKL